MGNIQAFFEESTKVLKNTLEQNQLLKFGMMLMGIGVPSGNGRYRLPDDDERKVYPWLA